MIWPKALLLQQPDRQSLGSLRVGTRRYDFVENISVLVDGSPKPVFLATYGNRHLVQVPVSFRDGFFRRNCFAYPRVSVGRRENAPDPSGEAISIRDGRAILRRGADSGYAEVDFVGQDGERYRVR